MPPLDQRLPASEVAPVYEAAGRRLRPSAVNEQMLRLKAQLSRERVMALRDRPEDDPERVQAEIAFEEDNLDLEIFDLTHDPTGALKREAIGADLAKQLSERIPAEGEPQPAISPELLTPVFLVNMGELDRLNKVSSDFSNEALTRLADILSDRLDETLSPIAEGQPESFYKLYRADNNSFMVRFVREIPKEVAETLRTQMTIPAGRRWEAPPAAGETDRDLFEGRTEAPPVIVDYVSVEEVLSGMPPSLRTSGKAETYAVGALKDVLFSMQEAHKIVSRVERMQGVMGDESKARELYDKYLKKSIAGIFTPEVGPSAKPVPVETFEQFSDFLKTLDADPGHAQAFLREQAFAKVLADLRVRYGEEEKYLEQVQGFVSSKAKKEYEITVNERHSAPPPEGALPKDKPVNEFLAPDPKAATEGLRLVAELETAAAAAMGTPREQVAQKRLARERLMRNSATGLELRGQLFKRLETSLQDPSKRNALVSMDMGFLKYFDQVGGKETGDMAVLKVAEVFQRVKDQFSKDGIEVNVYRPGGDEFVMSVTGEGAVSPEAFQECLRKLQAELIREVERAGRIPPLKGAKPGYYATNLNIGIGIYSYENGEAAEEADQKYGLTANPPEGYLPGLPAHEAWVRNKRAEHLFHVAEKVMEFQKASNRLMLLVEKMKVIQDLKATGADAEAIRREEVHLKQLVAFSDKAIGGKKGRVRLGVEAEDDGKRETSGVRQTSWVEQLAAGASPEDLDGQIHEYVWDMMDQTFQTERAERKDLAQHVGYAVRIEYLSGRVRELEARIQEGGDVSEKLKERYAHERQKLQQKLKAAEEDLEAVRMAKAAISA